MFKCNNGPNKDQKTTRMNLLTTAIFRNKSHQLVRFIPTVEVPVAVPRLPGPRGRQFRVWAGCPNPPGLGHGRGTELGMQHKVLRRGLRRPWPAVGVGNCQHSAAAKGENGPRKIDDKCEANRQEKFRCLLELGHFGSFLLTPPRKGGVCESVCHPPKGGRPMTQ